MLDGLAAAGLVTRVRSEQDRRVVLTSLTQRGRAMVEERRARYEPRWLAALDEFSERDLRAAAAVLDRLRGLFDELAAERVDDVVERGRPG
jgi:DNA-binding MarR family transcriptional regulator